MLFCQHNITDIQKLDLLPFYRTTTTNIKYHFISHIHLSKMLRFKNNALLRLFWNCSLYIYCSAVGDPGECSYSIFLFISKSGYGFPYVHICRGQWSWSWVWFVMVMHRMVLFHNACIKRCTLFFNPLKWFTHWWTPVLKRYWRYLVSANYSLCDGVCEVELYQMSVLAYILLGCSLYIFLVYLSV